MGIGLLGSAMRIAVAPFALSASIGAASAQAPLPGCDIATSSYVVIAPPSRKPAPAVITAMPQTPCATIPNGYEGVLGQINIDVNPMDPRQTDASGQASDQVSDQAGDQGALQRPGPGDGGTRTRRPRGAWGEGY
jgi:hypothetical protein